MKLYHCVVAILVCGPSVRRATAAQRIDLVVPTRSTEQRAALKGTAALTAARARSGVIAPLSLIDALSLLNKAKGGEDAGSLLRTLGGSQVGTGGSTEAILRALGAGDAGIAGGKLSNAIALARLFNTPQGANAEPSRAAAPQAVAVPGPPHKVLVNLNEKRGVFMAHTAFNGQDGVFVLDTGAQLTTMSARFADRLGLARVGQGNAAGAGGLHSISRGRVDLVDLYGLQMKNLEVGIIDTLGPGLDGVLGNNFLLNFHWAGSPDGQFAIWRTE